LVGLLIVFMLSDLFALSAGQEVL